MTLSDVLRGLLSTAHRGQSHDARLAEAEDIVVVSGTRGKSAATRWLYEILYSRETDVFAKITGDRPLSLYDGQIHEIERSRRVTLYENESELRRFAPVETLVLENQAIGEYTTRLVHRRFADPDVVFLTNVRRDHLARLGRDPLKIARSLARTMPSDGTVVIGEQHPEVRAVLEQELDSSDLEIRWVTVPEESESVPGAEIIYGLNEILESLDEQPLTDRRLDAYLDEMRVEWTQLPNGRVYNAASVNDVDSTEITRKALVGADAEPIQPFIYLRQDRRARTVSFLEYLDDLYDRDAFELARAVGPHAELFARHASFPVATHDETEPASEVLDAALTPGWPVLVVGNTVAEFMRELEAEIASRKLDEVSATQEVQRADVDETFETEQ